MARLPFETTVDPVAAPGATASRLFGTEVPSVPPPSGLIAFYWYFIRQAKALFVSIKDPAGGPPLAAKKLPVGPFPMTFEVTSADRLPMGGSRPTPDAVDVTIRLDFDGNAMPRADGEPAATFAAMKTGTAGIAAILK